VHVLVEAGLDGVQQADNVLKLVDADGLGPVSYEEREVGRDRLAGRKVVEIEDSDLMVQRAPAKERALSDGPSAVEDDDGLLGEEICDDRLEVARDQARETGIHRVAEL
jgi:hypothetical protein